MWNVVRPPGPMLFSRLLSCTCCSRSCLSRGQLGCSKESLGQLSLLGVKGLGCPRRGLSRERSCQPRIFMKTQKSQGVFVVCLFFPLWGNPKVVAEMNVPMIWRVPSWCLPKQDTSAWRPTTRGAVGSKELIFYFQLFVLHTIASCDKWTNLCTMCMYV